MRKFFLMGLCFGLFISCSNTINLSLEYKYTPPADVEMPVVENAYEIFDWISENMIYKYDDNDYWQSPHQTIERKTGDCEDVAILVMYYFQMFGHETFLIITKYEEKFHAIAEIDEDTWVDFAKLVVNGIVITEFSVIYLEPETFYKEHHRYSWQEVLIAKLFLY